MSHHVPAPKEYEVQRAIIEALRLAGCEVLSTSSFRQKGPSGCSAGIPDLLVRVPGMAPGLCLGLEVKRTAKSKLSASQAATLAQGFHLGAAASPLEAITKVMGRRTFDGHVIFSVAAYHRLYQVWEALENSSP